MVRICGKTIKKPGVQYRPIAPVLGVRDDLQIARPECFQNRRCVVSSQARSRCAPYTTLTPTIADHGHGCSSPFGEREDPAIMQRVSAPGCHTASGHYGPDEFLLKVCTLNEEASWPMSVQSSCLYRWSANHMVKRISDRPYTLATTSADGGICQNAHSRTGADTTLQPGPRSDIHVPVVTVAANTECVPINLVRHLVLDQRYGDAIRTGISRA